MQICLSIGRPECRKIKGLNIGIRTLTDNNDNNDNNEIIYLGDFLDRFLKCNYMFLLNERKQNLNRIIFCVAKLCCKLNSVITLF